MTDRNDHRAAAEHELDIHPLAQEPSYQRGILHALLAIHDALTAKPEATFLPAEEYSGGLIEYTKGGSVGTVNLPAADSGLTVGVLCGRCGHGINVHRVDGGCTAAIWRHEDDPLCGCASTPSAIARAHAARAVAEATGADEDVTLPEGWGLQGDALFNDGVQDGYVVRNTAASDPGGKWLALTYTTSKGKFHYTKQEAVDWLIEGAQ